MTDQNNILKNMVIKLVACETENEVVQVLTEEGYWNTNDGIWQPYGGVENNSGQIQAQSSDSTSALVEKLTNSGDSLLMLEAYKRGIDPKSNEAPQTMRTALKEFFGYPNGSINEVGKDVIQKNSNNIGLITTGNKSNPSYTVFDLGIGQTPIALPKTILSLGESNKDQISFLQGVFNQGGSAALNFCSPNHRLQLVVSKQHDLVKEKDASSEYYGFTIVRREMPRPGHRNPFFTYLAPGGIILKFRAQDLKILPKMPNKIGSNFPQGTFIKMYEYQNSTKSLNTWSHIRLGASLGVKMPGLPFPFKSFDCRKIGKEHRPRIIKGLEKKIFDSKNQIIEDNFPIGLNIKLNGENINAKIYVFKADAGERDQKELRNWKGNASIIYTNNGQTQHLRDHTVFNKKEFKKIRYIAKYIFITVDCSELSHLTKSDLFMSDRERVKQSKTYQKIENELTKLVSENNELRKIALERIEEDRSNKIKDSSDIETIFQDLVKQDQDLVKLFQDGLKGFLNPFSFGSGKKIKAYEGKRFPTQFKLAKQFTVQAPKKCLIDDDRYKIFFKTDAVNDYFDRDISPGSFSLKINGIETENYSTSLINGRFTLTLKLDDSKKINDKLYCEVTITDETRIEPFRENNFHMIIVSGKSKSSKGYKKPVKPTAPGDGNDKDKNHLELPFHIDPVYKKDWYKYDKMNGKRSIHIDINPENEKFIFFINMDNDYLLSVIKENPKNKELYDTMFKIGAALMSWRFLEALKDRKINEIEETIGRVNDLGPIMIPLMRQHSKIKVSSNNYIIAA